MFPDSPKTGRDVCAACVRTVGFSERGVCQNAHVSATSARHFVKIRPQRPVPVAVRSGRTVRQCVSI